MPDYRVLSRRYRPQRFRDVVGQEAIVTTLKNALRFKRLAHAYLFCGPRGTGKTTLARLVAKALNCDNPSAEFEPCDNCSSCRQIASSSAMDVIEIDGASHRGIDDVRQITETIALAPSPGKYKVYIIDEVHMLTKEAFNALLKTLEEPPPNVKFFLATTEPHRVPTTILSRCQRLNLQRVESSKICGKLQQVLKEEQIEFEESALQTIASMSEGCLRDSESLLEQVLAYQPKKIDLAAVVEALGIVPVEELFSINKAIAEQNFSLAFEISNRLYQEGKDLAHFLKSLFEHFRHLLLIILEGAARQPSTSYATAAKELSVEQCEYILDLLLKAQENVRLSPSPLIVLEMTLLKIIRSKYYLPVTAIAQRMVQLEKQLSTAQPAPVVVAASAKPVKRAEAPVAAPPVNNTPAPQAQEPPRKQRSQHDTLLQFAAVELEGSVKKP